MDRRAKRKSFSWSKFVLGAAVTFLALHFGLPPLFEPTAQLYLCASGALLVGLVAGFFGDTIWEIVVHLF